MSEASETKRLVKMVARSIRREPDRWSETEGKLVRDDGLVSDVHCFGMSCAATITFAGEKVGVGDGYALLSAEVGWRKRRTGQKSSAIIAALSRAFPDGQEKGTE